MTIFDFGIVTKITGPYVSCVGWLCYTICYNSGPPKVFEVIGCDEDGFLLSEIE